MSNQLLLGVAREIITPEVGGNLFGYSPYIYSKCVNDDLTSTVFVFAKEDKKAVMISLTIGNIEEYVADEIKNKISQKHGICADNILISATHTHSGPVTCEHEGWGSIDEKYVNSIMIPQTLKAVDTAVSHMCPVKMGYAQGNSYVGINRRQLLPDNSIGLGQNPYGCFNPNMTVLSFKDCDGNIVANMIHYGCHGTASGDNCEITRDWSGVMTDVVERESGGITAFFNGPEGDVGPRITNGTTTGLGNLSYALELGAVAANDAMEVYRKIKVYHDVPLKVYAGSVCIPLKKRIPLEEAEKEFEKFKNETINSKAGFRQHCHEIIQSYKDGCEDKSDRIVAQTIVGIGDIAFVGFPYELFAEIGMRIDEYSDIPYVLSLSNTNAAYGYFITEDQYCRGGYEVYMYKMAYVQEYREHADFALIKETLANLKKLN